MADPDLQIGEGGDGHPDPEIRGGGQVGAGSLVWSKNKGGPSPRSATVIFSNKFCVHLIFNLVS